MPESEAMRLLLLLLTVGLCAGERVVEVSAYDNAGPRGCARCCGKWAPLNRTASGTVPTVGRTIACNFLPFGTKVHIEGIGERVVEDRLSPKFGHRIDLLLTDHETALKFGLRKLKVTR